MGHKYLEVATTIRRQILSGDFNLRRQVSGRSIAADAGVSYLTARRALQQLLEDKVLTQKENGRVEINATFNNIGKKLKVALLQPNWFSTGMRAWICAIQNVICKQEGIFRTVVYSHDNDPAIIEVLDSEFDLIIFQLPELNNLLETKLKANRHRLISLYSDRTEMGINSVDGPAPESVDLLLQHLAELGHKKVAALNTEPIAHNKQTKTSAWDRLAKKRGLSNRLIFEPVKHFESADHRAYEIIKREIEKGNIDFTAMFGMSLSLTRGAMRAFYEAGYQIGKDISLCSFGDPESAMLNIPSITVIDMPDPSDVLQQAITHVLSGSEQAHMFRPQSRKLLIGESTGECPHA